MSDDFATPTAPTRTGRRRVPPWVWILLLVVGGLPALGALIMLSPFLIIPAIVVLITSIVAVSKRTRTWLRFRSHRAAIVVLAISASVFVVAGSTLAFAIPSIAAQGADRAAAEAAAPAATPTPTVTPTPTRTPKPTPTATAKPHAKDDTALALLATLDVKGRAPKTGYSRYQFGNGWLDPDRNGCDTRNDILARDLSDEVTEGPCKVLSGTLADPYTATIIHFVRGNTTSTLVQIDHVVALSDAWQKGAQQLTPARREALANDPLNLLAVDGPANAQKSDGDAATWLPANKAFRCTYVARQVSVKAAYDLWVTPAEHDAIERILKTCPDEPATTSTMAATAVEVHATEAPAPQPTTKPTPAPVQSAPPAPKEPEPAPVPSSPPANVYYKNCSAVRAAGVAPIRLGDPGYGSHLDRDGDGIACE